MRSASHAAAVPDAELPSYTILVPAYEEQEVIGGMVRCLEQLDKGMRLISPREPFLWVFFGDKAQALFMKGQYDQAIAILEAARS